jgi:rod shape-determining protein MreD
MKLSREYLLMFLGLLLALLLSVMPLPDTLSMARPAWVLLVLTAWVYRNNEVDVLVPAFIVGLALDALFNAVLGAHGLALVASLAVTLRLRVLLRTLILWQAMLVMLPILVINTLLLHWLDGLSGHSTELSARWWPVLSSFLLWPLVVLLHRRTRNESSASQV